MGDFGPKRRLPDTIPNGGGLEIQWCKEGIVRFFDQERSRSSVAPSDDIHTLFLFEALTTYFRPNFFHYFPVGSHVLGGGIFPMMK